MSNLIDRQAAIDAICRDGVRLERGGALMITISTAKQWAVDLLDKLPSAQPYTDEEIQKMQEIEQAQLDKAYEMGKADAVAEIIRCRDCKLRDTEYCNMAHGFMGMKDDDYCSYAERREVSK